MRGRVPPVRAPSATSHSSENSEDPFYNHASAISLAPGAGKFSARRMKPLRPTVVVLVTAPDLKTARRLATGAVRAHLAACANLLAKIESHYRWQGKLESSTEVLLLFKTTRAKLSALEKFILDHHLYDTPEFVVLSVTAGNRRYLEWIGESVK